MVEIGESGFSRTRRTDAGRLDRVQNAKLRTLGVDKAALESQVNDKAGIKAKEEEGDRYYAQLQNYFNHVLVKKELESHDAATKMERELCNFRLENQGHDRRLERDLDVPLREVKPSRIGDDDERCGAASMQKFDGEDLTAAERIKIQKLQQSDWAAEQIEHKVEQRELKEKEAVLFDHLIKYQTDYANKIAEDESATRKELISETSAINRKLAEEKKHRAIEARKGDDEKEAVEKEYITKSPFFTEDPTKARSSLSSHRKRVTEYKGMSAEELNAIFETQEMQRQEMVKKKKEVEMRDIYQDRITSQLYSQLEVAAVDSSAFLVEQRQMLAEELKRQQVEKKQKDIEINKLYKNVPTPAFFDQFGTSHR